MNIKFPEEYPLKPPEVCFLAQTYHLNINHRAPKSPNDIPLGKVSISTLIWWKPEYIIRELLINIFFLFFIPNPYNCFDLNQGRDLLDERDVYEEKIKYFTKKFANPMILEIKYDRNKDWDFSI